MDSMDLEREKGITILAKNTAVHHGDGEAQHRRHARPRRLRRRGRAGADDGRRRPAARRRLRGPDAADALRAPQGARGAAAGDLRDQQGRPARRPDRRRSTTRCSSSSSTSTPTTSRSSSRSSTPTPAPAGRRSTEGEEGTDLRPLLDLMVERIPAPEYDPEAPLQAHVTNLDADPYVGRLALCRVRNGTIRAGQPIAWCRADGTIERGDASAASTSPRRSTGSRPPRPGPGEIIAVSGIEEVTIGETLADPDDPRPLPVITVDEPSLAIVDRHQRLAARRAARASKLTARQIRAPARRRAGRQRLDPGRGHGANRRLGGPRPRRAPAGRAARADAPRGLRARPPASRGC